jgi:hypothetical protein
LPRFNPHDQVAAKSAVDDAVREAELVGSTNFVGTAGGDSRRLRGIPVVARGVSGVSPGTHPLDNVNRSVA